MNQRFYSLDVFRGATVAFMILVNNPGNWSHIYPPLEHAPWHGVTPTDLVFPFFLFAVGNALAFVLPRLESAGEVVFWRKIIRRTILILLIGIILNWFPFTRWEDDAIVAKPWAFVTAGGEASGVRIFGVLQRIALCYFFAAVIAHYLRQKGAFVLAAFLLFFYWQLCIFAHPADPFSLAHWFGTKIDLAIVGEAHIYRGEGVPFDPEGLMSLPAAIVQVIFGWLAGNYILCKGRTAEMLNGLLVAGALLLFTGYCWDMVFPINKKIWTSSFTVYTSGMAMLVLGTLIQVIEFRQWKGYWTKFFDVFGKNALFIFVLSGAIPRLLSLVRIAGDPGEDGKPRWLSPFGWFYEHVCKKILPADPRVGSLVYALCFIMLMWFFAWLLDRKKFYIKV